VVEERSVLGLYQGGNFFEFFIALFDMHSFNCFILRVDSMRVCIIEALNGDMASLSSFVCNESMRILRINYLALLTPLSTTLGLEALDYD
jgi:hypothetical protein